jgi:Holliday junction DNA helicase RuvA
MFYYIKGTLVYTDFSSAVIDTGGVAYKMTVSTSTLQQISCLKNDVKLYTYMAVREDAVDLFGFYTLEELSLFKLLITVSGVGPKAAMGVLSAFTPERFAIVVGSEDVKALSKANGVGAKTAARIILELKDKVAKEMISSKSAPIQTSGDFADAQNALMVLGYTKAEAVKALSGVSPALALEDMIKEALKKLMK